MNFRCFLLIFILAFPYTGLTQISAKGKYFSERKGNVRKAVRYYLRKGLTESQGFSCQYESLFSGLKSYTQKDKLWANQLLSKLYEVDSILFFKLMRIRLEWYLKERLVLTGLDSVQNLIKTTTDQAHYNYMKGLYYSDSYYEKLARHMGYVKAINANTEIVDWKKMNTMRWGSIKILEQIPNSIVPERPFKYENLKDSAIAYYKKAIENSRSEFFYFKEILFYLSKHNEKLLIQQLLNSNLNTYSLKERRWLRKVVRKYFSTINSMKAIE